MIEIIIGAGLGLMGGHRGRRHQTRQQEKAERGRREWSATATSDAGQFPQPSSPSSSAAS
ncbi:MAG: hypothetical protein ACLTSX_01095 [Collinsella sp.]